MSHLNQTSLISHIFYSTFVNICNNDVDFDGGNYDDDDSQKKLFKMIHAHKLSTIDQQSLKVI